MPPPVPANGVGGYDQPQIKREPDDSWERPLNEKDQQEQLKNLLENVAHTAAVPPAEQRMASPPDLKVQLLEHQKIGMCCYVMLYWGMQLLKFTFMPC
jgi:hypothetical protein